MNHLLLASLLFISSLAYAETPASEFAKYSTPVQNIQCKDLDFNSYHKVQNVKANILRTTPDRSRPNFAGKYLLLRNDFLFDTGWFVADCATGKFITEMLSTDHKAPKEEFRADSSLVAVISTHAKIQTPLEYHVFQNEKWMKVEAPQSTSEVVSPVAPAASPVAVNATPSVSDPLFNQYSAPTVATCKELDFNSNNRAQTAKKNLMENTPDRTRPNFGGHFLLLKGDTIFQTYWLLADCNTGKFFPDILTGGAYFEKASRLLKIYSSGDFATYYVWTEEDQQWIKLHGSNTLYGKSAKILFDSIPNPGRASTLRFENLKCLKDHCEVDVSKEKAKLISIPNLPSLYLQIKSGKCVQENNKTRCEIEI